ncbi:cholinesterase-like, partial [Oppia nitens]|uniref:cholinesterase-like n=1 Tax=Oppia nitens TaxID=1686743 RepID=UPI0023DADB46
LISLTKSNFVDIKTTSGTVRGHTISVFNHTVNEFLAIPYAKPPVGELRFDKPKPIDKPLKTIINATVQGYACMQPKLFNTYTNNVSEDCLVLNIWAPVVSSGVQFSTNTKTIKPVMVWFYGGGFIGGSIFMLPLHNGSILATNDMVIVTVNYRLDVFGFLYTNDPSAPGNVGIYDQQLALKWVKHNIHKFGGNSNQITIFGQSVGSWSVSLHILSPLSKGLFHRGIMQSGAQLFSKKIQMVTKNDALRDTLELAKHFNCGNDSKQRLKCLRQLDANVLFSFRNYSTKNLFHWNAIYDTHIFPHTAQVAFRKRLFNKDIQLLAGDTTLEGSELAYNGYPILHTNNVTKDVFIDLVKITKYFFHSVNINKITDYYLSNVDLNNSSAVRQAFFQYFGDVGITCPTYLFAKTFAEKAPKHSNVYLYQWNYGKSDGALGQIIGVSHQYDVPFVFGVPLVSKKFLSKTFNEEDKKFSLYIMKVWTDFAKYGKPDLSNKWSPINNIKDYNLKVKDFDPLIDSPILNYNPFNKICDKFWKNYYF